MSADLQAMGVLSRCDRAALSAYCQAWGRWVDAERQIVVSGAIVKSPVKGIPMQNPWLAVANRAMEQMRQFLAEFGLTPASRARVKVAREIVVGNDFDAFVNAG